MVRFRTLDLGSRRSRTAYRARGRSRLTPAGASPCAFLFCEDDTMPYSFTEKKRLRKNFGKQPSILEVPYLLAIQLNSCPAASCRRTRLKIRG